MNSCTAILLLSTSDTDLLSARAAIQANPEMSYCRANPTRLLDDDLLQFADGADVIIIRPPDGRRAWESNIDYFVNSSTSVVLTSGEQALNTGLTEYSTVPASVVT